jgi:hypothetical protein
MAACLSRTTHRLRHWRTRLLHPRAVDSSSDRATTADAGSTWTWLCGGTARVLEWPRRTPPFRSGHKHQWRAHQGCFLPSRCPLLLTLLMARVRGAGTHVLRAAWLKTVLARGLVRSDWLPRTLLCRLLRRALPASSIDPPPLPRVVYVCLRARSHPLDLVFRIQWWGWGGCSWVVRSAGGRTR